MVHIKAIVQNASMVYTGPSERFVYIRVWGGGGGGVGGVWGIILWQTSDILQ